MAYSDSPYYRLGFLTKLAEVTSLEEAYRILGINPGSDAASAKKAYRSLALKYHPDRNRGATGAALRNLERQFSDATAAYDYLTNRVYRATPSSSASTARPGYGPIYRRPGAAPSPIPRRPGAAPSPIPRRPGAVPPPIPRRPGAVPPPIPRRPGAVPPPIPRSRPGTVRIPKMSGRAKVFGTLGAAALGYLTSRILSRN